MLVSHPQFEQILQNFQNGNRKAAAKSILELRDPESFVSYLKSITEQYPQHFNSEFELSLLKCILVNIPAPERAPKTHEIKIDLEYYLAVRDGRKTFEIRKNDRDYRKGDSVILHAYDRETTLYLKHDPIERVITYVTDYGQQPGWVVFSI